jgi:uncharacterized protein (DUF849 family)
VTPAKRKVIITCAVTGATHTPSMSDHLAFAPEQIARQAIDAARAGASIPHLHARDPIDGRPTLDPTVFDLFMGEIAEETDAILSVVTTGGEGISLEERLAYPLRA